MLFQATHAQNKTDKTLSNSIILDTTIQPDYYQVKVAVAEWVSWTRVSKKKTIYELQNLDSIERTLKSDLRRLGFTQNLKKCSIAESVYDRGYSVSQKRYHNNQILFEVTFEFTISNKDSVNYLFKELNKEHVTSLIVTPKLNQATIDKAREEMINKSIVSFSKVANHIADSVGQKIIKQSNLSITFYPKPPVYNAMNTVITKAKDFLIDINDLEYTISIYIMYTLDDK